MTFLRHKSDVARLQSAVHGASLHFRLARHPVDGEITPLAPQRQLARTDSLNLCGGNMQLASSHSISEPRFDSRLGCYVHHLFYDFDTRFGHLWMGESSCCNMTTVIDIFIGIDPECVLIETFQAGGIPDTIYRRRHGKWQAFEPPHTPGRQA